MNIRLGALQTGIDSQGRPVYAPHTLSTAEKHQKANEILNARHVYPTAQRTQALAPYVENGTFTDAIVAQIRVNAYEAGNDVSKPPVKAEAPVFDKAIKPETFITRNVQIPIQRKTSAIPAALALAAAAYFTLK